MLKKVLLTLLVSAVLCAQPSIIHTPSTYLKHEHRTTLSTTIEDAEGFSNIRLYFKAKSGANFSFVNLSCKSEVCSIVLPKASADTLGLEYLFLVVDEDKKVYKTQKYDVVYNPKGNLPKTQQNLDAITPLTVMSEMSIKPTQIKGFSDNIIIDTAKPTARYGVAAGLYSQLSASAATATTKTSSVSTVIATTTATRNSTNTVVFSSVTVVAAGGGVVISLGGDDEESVINYKVTLQGNSALSATVIIKGDTCTYTETSTRTRALKNLPAQVCIFTKTNDSYRFETDNGDLFIGQASSDGKTLELLEQGGSDVLIFTRQ